MLIRNVLLLGIVIMSYYISLVAIPYIQTTLENLGIFGTLTEHMPSYNRLLWNFILYGLIPVVIIIAFIISTKPEKQYVTLGGIR